MTNDFFELSYKKYLLLGSICVAQNVFAKWWVNSSAVWYLLAGACWAVVFVTPLLFDIVRHVIERLHRRAEEEFQGVNYEFGRSRIRVLYSAGLVWLPTKDVHDALGLRLRKADIRRLLAGKRHRMIPGTQILGISEEHLAAFVSRTLAHEAQPFTLWFEREVLKPIRKKVERGLSVLEEVEQAGDA